MTGEFVTPHNSLVLIVVGILIFSGLGFYNAENFGSRSSGALNGTVGMLTPSSNSAIYEDTATISFVDSSGGRAAFSDVTVEYCSSFNYQAYYGITLTCDNSNPFIIVIIQKMPTSVISTLYAGEVLSLNLVYVPMQAVLLQVEANVSEVQGPATVYLTVFNSVSNFRNDTWDVFDLVVPNSFHPVVNGQVTFNLFGPSSQSVSTSTERSSTSVTQTIASSSPTTSTSATTSTTSAIPEFPLQPIAMILLTLVILLGYLLLRGYTSRRVSTHSPSSPY
ncbi:MAG: hypothetical protein JRN20_05740 [Nitrososphaerota archaeon]|nr:hypothetical protein [Nitrososphaerota archaeon]